MSGTESASPTKSSSNSSPSSSPEKSSPESTAAPTDAEDATTEDSSTTVEGSLPTKTGAPLVTTTGKGTGKVEPQSAQNTASAIADGAGNAMSGRASAMSHPVSVLIISVVSLIVISLSSAF